VPEIARVATLHTLLATYPITAALKQGGIESDLVQLDFADVRVANTAFKSLVRDLRFDIGELAIVTYLQAHACGTPYVLMPAVIVGRAQHQAIVYNPARGRLAPRDLEGRRVGVRAYTQTTGTWIRGVLEEDYGVDFTRVRWITFEDPHVGEYVEPPWVERAPAGAELLTMLLNGEIDAAVFGNDIPDAGLLPVIHDPETAAAVWAERKRVRPINHMVVVRRSLSTEQPELVREVFRLLLESKRAAPARRGAAAIRFGVEANRRSLELIIGYALRQRLIPRPLSVDELFDETTRVLRDTDAEGAS
jgi:4,5-dihydroxyphthalate decarboxylase